MEEIVYRPGDTITLELDLRDKSGVGAVIVQFRKEGNTDRLIQFTGDGAGQQEAAVKLTYEVPEHIEPGMYSHPYIEAQDGRGNYKTHQRPNLKFRIESPQGDFDGPELTDARLS